MMTLTWKAPTSAGVLEKLRTWLRGIGPTGKGGITLDQNEAAALVSKTQLSYLDLAAFYQQAKSVRALQSDLEMDLRWAAGDLANKLLCVIDAIRNDGLDPRWNPERDACVGAKVRGSMRVGTSDLSDYVVKVNESGARDIVEHLRKQGYSIVKDAE